MADHFYLRYDDTAALARKGLSAKSIVTLQAIRSPKTLAAYEADWDDFCKWCRFHGAKTFPATTETVINYMNELANYASAATVKRRISAISMNYRAAQAMGFPVQNPCDTWIVKETLIGIRKKRCAPAKGKTPLYWEDLQSMIRTMDLTTFTGLRDRAILLLGFMGALRRSELTALRIEDIHRHPLGIVIDVPLAKGNRIVIPDLTGKLKDPEMDCIRAMRAWVRAGGFRSGPLFRPITTSGRILEKPLSDGSINDIVKKYAAAIGLDPANYGSNSLRNGFADYAAKRGLAEMDIRKWKSR